MQFPPSAIEALIAASIGVGAPLFYSGNVVGCGKVYAATFDQLEELGYAEEAADARRARHELHDDPERLGRAYRKQLDDILLQVKARHEVAKCRRGRIGRRHSAAATSPVHRARTGSALNSNSSPERSGSELRGQSAAASRRRREIAAGSRVVKGDAYEVANYTSMGGPFAQVSKWTKVDDKVMGGRSEASLETTQVGYTRHISGKRMPHTSVALFSGVLRAQGGGGFASVQANLASEGGALDALDLGLDAVEIDAALPPKAGLPRVYRLGE